MKFRGNRQRLLDALTVLGTVIAPRSIKPILQNLRLVVDPDGASLLGTDLEVAIRYRVPLDSVEEGGDLLLPASRLLGILRESAGDEVIFSGDDQIITVDCGNGSFKIMGQDPEEFPVVPVFQDEGTLSVTKDDLRTLIRKTSFATAREKTRYAFNAVRFEVEGDEARMVASDGKRMAVKTLPIDNPDGVTLGHLIPAKGLTTFDKVLTDDDQVVRLRLEERQVMLQTRHAEVSSRLVEGAFPRYDAGIPKQFALTATFAREEIISGLRRASILTSEESRSVRMQFDENGVVMTARAVDVGEARVQLEARVEGQPLEVAFNPEFLVEGIKVMDSETVSLKVSGPDTPAIVEGEENFIYVVMPVTRRAG